MGQEVVQLLDEPVLRFDYRACRHRSFANRARPRVARANHCDLFHVIHCEAEYVTHPAGLRRAVSRYFMFAS